jgi:hypothetical protein
MVYCWHATPHRRTATRVRGGRVQKKQNWAVDRGDYRVLRQDEIRLDRANPGMLEFSGGSD